MHATMTDLPPALACNIQPLFGGGRREDPATRFPPALEVRCEDIPNGRLVDEVRHLLSDSVQGMAYFPRTKISHDETDMPWNWVCLRCWPLTNFNAPTEPDVEFLQGAKCLWPRWSSLGTPILLGSTRVGQAYSYGLRANRRGTHLATFRAVAKKHPHRAAREILKDLAATTPGDEGRWFAAAKDAGLFRSAATARAQSPHKASRISAFRTALCQALVGQRRQSQMLPHVHLFPPQHWLRGDSAPQLRLVGKQFGSQIATFRQRIHERPLVA